MAGLYLKKCDRCGKTYDPDREVDGNINYKMGVFVGKKDLCHDCVCSLDKWIHKYVSRF